jgi:hypothetical protein
MTVPIDNETNPEEYERSAEETRNGNPGKPQSHYEHPVDEPTDEPPTGADRAHDHRA